MSAETMKMAAVHGRDDVRLDDVALPKAGPRDIIVRVSACGICGSDLGYARAGGLPLGDGGPLPLGHEFAGVVEQVGEAVSNFRPGERVTVNPTTEANMIGSGGPGGFAPLILVRDAESPDTVHRLPDAIDDRTAALTEPFAVGLHAVHRSAIDKGAPVVVFGAGPIGLAITAMLKVKGAGDVVVVDKVDERLDRALKMGADAALNPDRDDVWATIGERHGEESLYGQDVVATRRFIDAAGVPAIVGEVLLYAPFGARLTVVAVHHAPVSVDLTLALGKEMEIVTAMAYPTEFEETLALLASGRIDTSAYVSHVMPFERFGEAFAIAGRPEEAAKVLVTFD